MFLAGLLPRLEQWPDVQTHSCVALAELCDLCACDAVLIDLYDARAADVLTLLRACPDLRVVGVNPSAVTVFAGQVHRADTLEEVTRTICDF